MMDHSERVKAGQAKARAEGKRIGRPPRLSPEQEAMVPDLIKKGGWRLVATHFGISINTVAKTLRKMREGKP